jgi:hypothetical protein
MQSNCSPIVVHRQSKLVIGLSPRSFEAHWLYRLPLALALVCGLAACANRPETIRASYVSHERFMDLDCDELSLKLTESRVELEKMSRVQNEKANADAFGVFLLGIPFSKLSGDVEGEVARLKGQVEAVETAAVKKKCKGAV